MDDTLWKRIREMQNGAARHQEMIDAAAKLAAPAMEAARALEVSSSIHHLIDQMNLRDSLIQAAIGPMQELQSLSLPITQAMDHTRHLLADYESHFRLPAESEIAQLALTIQTSPAMDVAWHFSDDTTALKQAMQAMQSPWLDIQQSVRSLAGFAELQGIGQALISGPAFSEHLAGVLRAGLGDWRDKISWPKPIFTDLDARTNFYVDRGFNLALTNFPATAFRESLNIAGLHDAPPALADRYGPFLPKLESDSEVEEAFIRTNRAHDRLQRFETQLRRYIDATMTAAYGPDWPKKKLPNGMYEDWRDKQHRAGQGRSADLPLIAFADFTHYELIICKRDNWREVFAPTFGRIESVRESFQRLYPVRVCTMHARLITHEDELYLYVEVKRLMKAIS